MAYGPWGVRIHRVHAIFAPLRCRPSNISAAVTGKNALRKEKKRNTENGLHNPALTPTTTPITSLDAAQDWSIGVAKVVSFLAVFMAGLILGSSINAHFGRFYTSQADLFFPRAVYSDCDGNCLSLKHFIKPSHLMHSMTDEELFWRASMVPRMAEYPFQRVPKVAFLFMTRGALPFAPLWDRFFKGHEGLFSVYVHSLPDYRLNVSKESAFHGRQIPSEEVSWGSITLVDAEKRLLANALLDFSTSALSSYRKAASLYTTSQRYTNT
uniref:Uncharacterized protein n=1 Tax=Ananas comosus var. bracteatus TaxID=296719 RepID=A0A6V7Q7A8_ANACO|nr:unnamed protein product [Ananas comosus var. bracteatus]